MASVRSPFFSVARMSVDWQMSFNLRSSFLAFWFFGVFFRFRRRCCRRRWKEKKEKKRALLLSGAGECWSPAMFYNSLLCAINHSGQTALPNVFSSSLHRAKGEFFSFFFFFLIVGVASLSRPLDSPLLLLKSKDLCFFRKKESKKEGAWALSVFSKKKEIPPKKKYNRRVKWHRASHENFNKKANAGFLSWKAEAGKIL